MNVGVLVPSHDAYSDLWPIAAELFTRYWPDREWPMYWMTNGAAVPSIASQIVMPVIQWEQWGYNVAAAVESLPHDLILFWIEEELLLSKVPNDLFREAAEIMSADPSVGITQLTHYYHRPKLSDATVGSFTDSPIGFGAALPCLCRKEVLAHLLKARPVPNEFEQQHHLVMACELPGIRSLISCKPMFKFCDNAVVNYLRGAWRKCAVQHIQENGFNVDFGRRGIAPDECRFMDGTPA